jgi:hypothetical protein
VEKWSFEHPTIRRLTSLCRHQLSPIARDGDDTLVFNYYQRGIHSHDSSPSPTFATVVDFHSGHDVIEIDGAPNGTDFSDVQIRHRGGDTFIAIGDDHITLTGIHQVTANDFIFNI